MTIRAVLLAGALGLTACWGFDGKAPDGFAEFDDWTQLRAVSASGVVYRVRTEENEPEAELGFWREALKKRMLDAGYALVSEAELKMGNSPGYLLELAAPVGVEDYTYLLGVTVRGDEILVAEATGEVTRFAPHREAVVAAMQTVR